MKCIQKCWFPIRLSCSPVWHHKSVNIHTITNSSAQRIYIYEKKKKNPSADIEFKWHSAAYQLVAYPEPVVRKRNTDLNIFWVGLYLNGQKTIKLGIGSAQRLIARSSFHHVHMPGVCQEFVKHENVKWCLKNESRNSIHTFYEDIFRLFIYESVNEHGSSLVTFLCWCVFIAQVFTASSGCATEI